MSVLPLTNGRCYWRKPPHCGRIVRGVKLARLYSMLMGAMKVTDEVTVSFRATWRKDG